MAYTLDRIKSSECDTHIVCVNVLTLRRRTVKYLEAGPMSWGCCEEPDTGGLKQQKCILPDLWRPQV